MSGVITNIMVEQKTFLTTPLILYIHVHRFSYTAQTFLPKLSISVPNLYHIGTAKYPLKTWEVHSSCDQDMNYNSCGHKPRSLPLICLAPPPNSRYGKLGDDDGNVPQVVMDP